MRHFFPWALVLAFIGCGTATTTTSNTDDAASLVDATAADSGGTTDVSAPDAVTADTGPADSGPVWVGGERKLSGAAYFFNATGVGAIEQQKDVTGATAYLLEFPDHTQALGPDGAFTFSGLPEGGEFTVAVVHPDYFPSLSPIIAIGKEDVKDVNFQVVTQLIAVYLGVLVGFDSNDPTQCQMVVTVTAHGDSQNLWWAPGEPGATVTTEPALTAEHGPYYFNTSVVPDKSLTETTSDGGVLIAGATPGIYTWTAHKAGTTFTSQRLKCVGGWLTNGVPPFGLLAEK